MKGVYFPIVLVTATLLAATPSFSAAVTATLPISAIVVTPCETQGTTSTACADYKIKATEYAARMKNP